MTVPRELIPYATDDMSALAKSLRRQMTARTSPPSHVEMLNMLARAAGHRNFQHLRAQATSRIARDPAPRGETSDEAAVTRAARYFDDEGRLRSWPARTAVQNFCLWMIWANIPPSRPFDERAISALIGTLHLFGDSAIIRRTMCHIGLMSRTQDGHDYRRIEQEPSSEAAALIRRVHEGAP